MNPYSTHQFLSELALILRDQHPAWEGDRILNGESFCFRIHSDMPENAATIAHDILGTLGTASDVSGLSPNSLRRHARILLEGL